MTFLKLVSWENACLFSSKMLQELKQAYEFRTESIYGLKKSRS